MMTKELHDKLTKYELIFRTAIDSKYYRAMDSRFAAAFIEGCKEMNVYLNTSCGSCVLKALLTLGKLYFDYTDPEPPVSSDDPDCGDDNKTIKQEKKASKKVSKLTKKTK